jgi:hypothetical protein
VTMKGFAASASPMLCIVLVSGISVAGEFKKLSGSQIKATFPGMKFTDHVHWSEAYGDNGTVTTREMGTTRVGTWRVEGGELCVDLGKEGGNGCYEVWMSGNSVELRTPGSSALPFQGVLEKQTKKP